MFDRKYQIFISSTFIDLKHEREQIIKAILELYHIPIGMEMFSAQDEDQWEIIRKTIEKSDYYILILGLRYGSVTSEGISFTQKEYEYALEQKIPILSFVLDDQVSLSKDKRDDDLSAVNQFRTNVLKNSKMSDFWTTSDELIKKVSIALMKQIMQKPGIGWIRGDQGVSPELSDELTYLSKENRLLREKIIELESKITQKKPNIEIKINHKNELSLKLETIDFNPINMPEKIDINSIENHLIRYITQMDIDKYNASLPTNAEVDKFNRELEIWNRIKKKNQNLHFEVCNVGTIKANEVFVTIEFPKEVIILKKTDISKIPLPKSPVPDNPIAKAKEKYSKAQDKFGLSSLGIAHGNVMSMNHNILEIPNLDRRYWTKLDKNVITIKLESLVHTRSIEFDNEYTITPLIKGDFDILVGLFCEEYEEEIHVILPLKIVE